MHHSYIDRFAHQDTPLGSLDARAKLLAVLAYSVVLISFGRHEVLAMAPMAVMPLAMLAAGRVPLGFALRRVATLCPLIAMLALAAPIYERGVQDVAVGPWHWTLAAGWLTAGAIAVKFALGLLALTALVCTTPFALLLEAMRKLALPRLLVMELAFLYRYIFVLIDQAMRIRRGRDFRGAARAPLAGRLGAVGGIVGSLFVRTLDRSQRIHTAMCARSYRGEPRALERLQWRAVDAAFLAAVGAYLVLCRSLA